jgi:hypothetical protein
MSSESAGKGDIKQQALFGQRTYRVSARILKQFPEIINFVSPLAHIFWHLEITLYPELAGKVNVFEILDKPEELRKLPPGFLVLDTAIVMRFNRDLARFALNFNSATLEELLAAKFKESDKVKKFIEAIKPRKQEKQE